MLFLLGSFWFGCTSSTVKEFNANPTVTITSHADGDTFLESFEK